MGTITTKDDTRIFYKDWGKGRPVVFSHGWPLSSDIWDEQLFHFASNGFRAVAHDRRGHGRSSQPWNGNDMDTFADDLAAVLESLDLRDAMLVGHSMGGGEVTRYLARHGARRVSKAVLDDDQIVPIEDSAKLAVELLRRGTLNVYEGGSHGLWATHRQRFTEDLLSFAKG